MRQLLGSEFVHAISELLRPEPILWWTAPSPRHAPLMLLTLWSSSVVSPKGRNKGVSDASGIVLNSSRPGLSQRRTALWGQPFIYVAVGGFADSCQDRPLLNSVQRETIDVARTNRTLSSSPVSRGVVVPAAEFPDLGEIRAPSIQIAPDHRRRDHQRRPSPIGLVKSVCHAALASGQLLEWIKPHSKTSCFPMYAECSSIKKHREKPVVFVFLRLFPTKDYAWFRTSEYSLLLPDRFRFAQCNPPLDAILTPFFAQ